MADNSEWTPLHGASKRDHKDVVELLLNKGADPTAVGDYGQTALHRASSRSHKDVVELNQLHLYSASSLLTRLFLSYIALHFILMNYKTMIHEGYCSDDDWIDSQQYDSNDKENNADDNFTDFNSVYDISDDDSQEELLNIRLCISCDDSQPLENFRYRSQRSNISRRLPYSWYCEKCRKSRSLKRSANRCTDLRMVA